MRRMLEKVLMLLLVAGGWATGANAQTHDYNATTVHPDRGVTLHYLGADNGLVRITGQESLVLLPIEESAPDATVRVLVNNQLVKTFNARLAMNSVDYFVPFDLKALGKGKVLLDVRTAREGKNVRPARDAKWSHEVKLASTFDTTNTETYRPLFHFTPKYAWMNDPNGMVYKDGEYHLSFQYGPYGSTWNNMTWGHAVSRDLVNWEELTPIIEPNGLGSIFSGSAVVDKANTAGFGAGAMIAIFTSAGHKQIQSLAYSTDNGRTYRLYDGNPIITSDKECRDPNLFWNDKTARWNLILSSALEKEILFYSSANLKDWTFESAFGKGYGCQEGVWECPDLMELPIRGTNEKKWVLIVNINPGGIYGGSATQYFVGSFDGHKFTCESPSYLAKWMDYGKDHYATVSWSDAPNGRRTVIGWMSNWQYGNDVPTMQFRSANTIARDLGLFRDSDGECYLSVVPSPEIETLRGEKAAYHTSVIGAEASNYSLPTANDGVCEIVVDYEAKGCRNMTLTLSNSKGENVVMTIDPNMQQFSMDRSKSGIIKFSRHFPSTTTAPMHNSKGKGQLRLFIDRCSIEAFAGDGHFAMTNLVFPNEPYSQLAISADGGKAKVNSVTIYPIIVK
ncbi:MAG: GH32 C-terminal domain-containing protein [Bacteroidaceae bacterium]|nr:GH32 C-terminal domain-containing protein [Bacteroidaceae bacterium]